MVYEIESMALEDIPEVNEIERAAFGTTWPMQAYRREIKENKLARYVVARWFGETPDDESPLTKHPLGKKTEMKVPPTSRDNGVMSSLRRAIADMLNPLHTGGEELLQPSTRQLGGYAGLWLMLDEAHITTIAVRPCLQHKGLGIILMLSLVDIAREVGADRMTLEVRVSNYDAQSLYRKFSFKEEGVRRRYYSDNNEDALIMWSEPLNSEEFEQRLVGIRQSISARLQLHPLPPPSTSISSDITP